MVLHPFPTWWTVGQANTVPETVNSFVFKEVHSNLTKMTATAVRPIQAIVLILLPPAHPFGTEDRIEHIVCEVSIDSLGWSGKVSPAVRVNSEFSRTQLEL